ARRFLAEACARAGRDTPALSAATLQKLSAWSWPGNVRELRNVIEYVVATFRGEAVVEPWHLTDKIAGVEEVEEPAAGAAAPVTSPSGRRFRLVADELQELERTRMVEALHTSGGVQRRAAELIGMPLRTFVMKIKQYG